MKDEGKLKGHRARPEKGRSREYHKNNAKIFPLCVRVTVDHGIDEIKYIHTSWTGELMIPGRGTTPAERSV